MKHPNHREITLNGLGSEVSRRSAPFVVGNPATVVAGLRSFGGAR